MARSISTRNTSTESPAKFRAKRGEKRVPVVAAPQDAHAEPGSQSVVSAATVRLLHEGLLRWYAASKRDLPWRRTRDPYAIWLSEVMLQQTRVETVIPYYERFLASWPDVGSLAEAPVGDVLAAWSGLGYYRRARMLHDAARTIAAAQVFPENAEQLGRVKGIGRYTAGAVASIAYGEAAPLVDGNVARVFARLFAMDDDVKSTKGVARAWEVAEALVHRGDPGAWNQALMELGATICVPRDPRCLVCPVRAVCKARELGLERELPRVKAKAKPRVQARWALVATRGDKVLLGRRRADLRFGGLWEPPSLDSVEAESEREASFRLSELVGATLDRPSLLGDVTHVLSHRRLEIQVIGASVARAPLASDAAEYDLFEWVDPATLGSRGVSTLARKILATAIG